MRLYPDVAAGVHKKQKEFDEARWQLRLMGLRYGILPPARLIVTVKEQSYIFNNHIKETDFKRIKAEESQDWIKWTLSVTVHKAEGNFAFESISLFRNGKLFKVNLSLVVDNVY